ncbi:MAG: DeoR/GlpR family DNA-binding transcription regulator [Propionibacteriaceae bacterium]|jgi:DeoR/GlpR family transcriptional regulator of sugar metabolism|nr:DeoR/GlpR family DNA-binding transcription regulator [Propionibacteriaceae bacterium]
MITTAVTASQRTVSELADLTGASAITIRRDLAELADLGAIRRIRGGAAASARRGSSYPFALRLDDHHSQKEAIAQAAVLAVHPGDCVLLDNGTTAIAVARRLSGAGVTAMALSLHVAAALAERPGDEVIVPGGPIDHDDLAFIGAGAADAVRAMRYDIALISSCAADPATGLSVERWGDAQVKQAILASSRRVVLLATADKFRRTAAHVFAQITDLDAVITADDTPDDIVRELELAGADVTVARASSQTSAARPSGSDA